MAADTGCDNGKHFVVGVVVALLDDEATLKRIYRDKEKQKILLVPENDAYETREVDHCIIQGIARKVIKDIV